MIFFLTDEKLLPMHGVYTIVCQQNELLFNSFSNSFSPFIYVGFNLA